MEYRIGQGLDVHPFKAGRKLYLGGIQIPHSQGLDGHSDADALIHALIDALLGAAGKEDIGTLFPDSSQEWKDADSKELLETVVGTIKTEGWSVVNIDATVLTEEPRLKPYVPAMRETLSRILGIQISCCTIKAGTNEKMGFVGRKEGLMAQCVVLLQR